MQGLTLADQSEKSSGQGGKATASAIEAYNNRQAALELRMGGATYQEIGEKLGFTRQRAFAIIKEELSKLNEERANTRESLRSLMNERYDKILRKLWNNSGVDNDDGEVDIPLLDRVFRVLDAQTKLNGLDAITDKEEAALALQSGGSRLALLVLKYLPEEKRAEFMDNIRQMVAAEQPKPVEFIDQDQ